jgi:pilus assembly protein Flp/PilA
MVGTFFSEELRMKSVVARFFQDESGVTAIEYGLIAALISVVCIAAMTAAGQSLLAVYNSIGAALAGALPQ